MWDLGRREEALAAIEEAVTAYRHLAGGRPDAYLSARAGAYLPDLATCLKSYSDRLSDLGRRQPALAAIEESVAIYRQLANAQPGVFQPDLATALTILAHALKAAGRASEAAAALREAAELSNET
jgi:tetratricopeptide (TPR) repeat protein